MAKNPEDKNKIRRTKVGSDDRIKRPASSRTSAPKSGYNSSGRDSDSARSRSDAGRSQVSRSRTPGSTSSRKTNPDSKTRVVSSSSSGGNRPSRKPPKNIKGNSKVLKRKLRSRRKKKIIGGIIAGLIVCFAIGLGFIFASLKDVKPVNEALLDKLTHQTTTIKYANGEVMSQAPTLYKKTPIPLSDMSPWLIKAIVSIEDERFYSHDGIDYIGLGRSVVKTLSGQKQGGSTIPMQVSKILLTSSDQTFSRKIKDIYYAMEMSKTVDKDKILETYLNNYFVGRGMVGAEAGSMGYFDKKCKDLTLGEAAMLAGVTKNPSKYAPYVTAPISVNDTKESLDHKLIFYLPNEVNPPTKEEKMMYSKLYDWGLIDLDTYKQLKSDSLCVRKAVNNEKAKERQEVVLGKMKQLGVITDKQYNEAIRQPIVIRFPESKERVASAVESLIEYDVINALMEQGKTEDEARNMYYNGGLIINSTIDPKIQEAIEGEYANTRNFPNDKVAPNGLRQPQSATVVLDYKTGGIKGLIGGRNIKARKTLNRAITPFQPGSTIKPLSVYTPAIDTLKITQSTLISDVRGGYRFKENQKDNPETTTQGYGSMCIRHGLALSSNTVAYKTGELLGPTYEDCIDVMMDYLRNFGITTILDFKEKDKPGMQRSDRHFNSLVLGGLTKGVSPLQMSAAFGALANAGVYVEPEIFTTITSYNGELIYKNIPQTHRVVDPGVAYVLTDMLKAVVTEGIGKNAAISNMPVAGKTGSTNNYLDTWFVGYTPYYSAATYIGDDYGIKNEDGTFMKRRPIEGGASMSSSILWQKIMARIHKNLPNKTFIKPNDVYMTGINPVTGARNPYGVQAAFMDGTAPDRYGSYTPPVRQYNQPNQNSYNRQQQQQQQQQQQYGTQNSNIQNNTQNNVNNNTGIQNTQQQNTNTGVQNGTQNNGGNSNNQ